MMGEFILYCSGKAEWGIYGTDFWWSRFRRQFRIWSKSHTICWPTIFPLFCAQVSAKINRELESVINMLLNNIWNSIFSSKKAPKNRGFGGGKGIRTLVGLHPNGFQDRLVMTASIPLRIWNCLSTEIIRYSIVLEILLEMHPRLCGSCCRVTGIAASYSEGIIA